MSLDVVQLENFIINILEHPPNSMEEAAHKWATIIVDYSSKAEFVATAPGIHPTSGVTDTSIVGQKLKVNSGIVELGSSILEPALLNGFELENPLFIGLQLGISSFVPTLASWSGSGYIATVIATPVPFLIPGYFAPVITLGLTGASNQQVATLLANMINTGFVASLLNGAAVNPAGFVAPVVASPII